MQTWPQAEALDAEYKQDPVWRSVRLGGLAKGFAWRPPKKRAAMTVVVLREIQVSQTIQIKDYLNTYIEDMSNDVVCAYLSVQIWKVINTHSRNLEYLY